ncbi:MAG: alginate export family protein [Kangiellaceae bacterium]|nr:alginate export family protein [Kangiellaceae bacterium]
MKSKFRKRFLTASILAAFSLAAAAEDVVGHSEVKSTLDLSFRYRIETVDQSNFDETAQASTLRTRATVKTTWTDIIDTVIEFDDVTEIGLDDYNSGAGTSPNTVGYPVIADPVGTELNQGYIRLKYADSKLALGRQRILVGNQRFVGGVGWRQNEQTYDSLTFTTKFKQDLSFNYAYLYNVNRIFGESVSGGDHTHNTHLINADIKLGNGKLSGYYFAIDNEDAAALSNDTFGLRYSGKLDNIFYNLEFASQSDAGDNPNSYDANYYLIDASYKTGKVSLGGGLEVLGGDSDGGQGFTTSLATLHKFQGWADVFLGTPIAGIEDTYINGSYTINGIKFKAIYHDFATDEGGNALGTELDFVISKKVSKHLSALLKLASFDSDSNSYTDRDKVWVMFNYKL